MSVISNNSVSLAGEFAVLSQLMLHGYDANMTLGRTKGVDILVSDPETKRMLKLEVKTSRGVSSKSMFGNIAKAWMMNSKHEKIRDPQLFYCFVSIAENDKHFRFFIVPSAVVADYVEKQHEIWMRSGSKRSTSSMRKFRIGLKSENYPLPTPTIEEYEDNWSLLKKIA